MRVSLSKRGSPSQPGLIGSRLSAWEYTYQNVVGGDVILWVSLPRRRPGQRDIYVTFRRGVPEETILYSIDKPERRLDVSEVNSALNEPDNNSYLNVVSRFVVRTNTKICINADFTSYPAHLSEGFEPSRGLSGFSPEGETNLLNGGEREYYLRSTCLVRVTEEIKTTIERQTRGLSDDASLAEAAIAKALLDNFTLQRYKYEWPPLARGSDAVLAAQSGDCGNLSLLFAAQCRALGLPCRTLFGSWVVGKMQAHVWNEVFISGYGWIPVDVTRFAVGNGSASRGQANWSWLQSWKRGTSSLGMMSPTNRIAFSIEAEPHSLSGYPESITDPGVFLVSCGTQSVKWGFELLGGNVPYLQPAYPRFMSTNAEARVTDAMLLGNWRMRDSVRRRISRVASNMCMLFGVSLFALGLYLSSFASLQSKRIAVTSFVLFALIRVVGDDNRRFYAWLSAVLCVILVIFGFVL